MPRRGRYEKHELLPDSKFNSLLVSRFVNKLMMRGKKGKDARGRRPWENWVTTDDLDGLARWQEMFGPGFRAILAFAYALPGRAQEDLSGRYAFADSTLLRDTLGLKFQGLFRIADSLEFVDTDPSPSRVDVVDRLRRGEITAQEAIRELEGKR